MSELTPYHDTRNTVSTDGPQGLPSLIQQIGPGGAFVWEEFFLGRLANPHTKVAYERVIRRFLAWSEPKVESLAHVTPGMIGVFLRQLNVAPPSQKLALAALRNFFQLLTERHMVVLNPAASVRTERFRADDGRTPEITPTQSRQLLASIDTSTLIGQRDRAIIATLIYTAARAGAVAKLARGSLVDEGTQYMLHFREKNGVRRHIPVRHDLEQFLIDYLQATGWVGAPPEAPLFRTAVGKADRLNSTGISAVDICRMVKRRCQQAGLPRHLSPHGFRVGTVTDLLRQGVPLEDVSYLAGHADMRTTRLYDRRHREVTRNIVERISV